MIKTWDLALLQDTTTDGEGFWLNGRYFPIIRGGADDNSDAGDGEGDGTETDDSDDTSDDTDDDSKGKAKTFTQDQLNAIVSREAAKAARGKLDPKEMGFESAKEMKAALEAAKALTDAQKTEAEKALEEAKKEAATAARSEVLDVANKRLLRAEFIVAATQAKVAFTDDAFALAPTLDIWEGVEIKDDGSITGLDDAFFEALKEAKPFLWAADDEEDRIPDGAAGARGGDKGHAARTTELKEKFPALNR